MFEMPAEERSQLDKIYLFLKLISQVGSIELSTLKLSNQICLKKKFSLKSTRLQTNNLVGRQ